MSASMLPIVLQRGIQPRQGDSVEAYFKAWYAEYPRKDAPMAALRAYRAVVRQLGLPIEQAASVLLQGLRRYRFSPERQYRPLPATWLNQGRYMAEDETQGLDPVLAAAGIKPEDLR